MIGEKNLPWKSKIYILLLATFAHALGWLLMPSTLRYIAVPNVDSFPLAFFRSILEFYT